MQVSAQGSIDPGDPAVQTARLLEQLMQIARTSALEEMASGIAHELNQPIGAITTFAQTGERMLSRTEPMVGEVRELLRYISDEALKAGRGIHRIRGLFEAQGVTKTDCDIAEVIDELRPVLTLLAKRSGARLEIEIQPDLPTVSADRLRIQHVVFTLVQNALEAPHAAGVPPAVRLQVSSDRYFVSTAVTDHGSGIAAEARDQIFRPFFTTKASGTGLGLASSRAIVESHGGTINFEDAPGGGTTFSFRLPANSGAHAP
jgi:C4-dicarboxylate-specific signal transduction histidine kinase